MTQKLINKKVIFLLPVWGGGGGERVACDLSFNLPENIEKIIVAFENKNYYPFRGRIISLNLSLSTNPILKFLNFLKGYFVFRKIISKEKPDYVISFGSLQNIINILAFRKSIVRVDNPITISHQKFIEKLYPLFVRILFNRAYKVVVVSEGLKQELIKRFKIREENINVVYNSIDIGEIKKLSQEPLEPAYEKIFKHPVIINIGSLIGQKGQANLIKAFKGLKAKIKDAKLVILGEGVLENRLKKMTKNFGLEEDVHFLGWQKNPFKFLARSEVFAMPSLWEGFGIVILEAMACRVPVVSSDCEFGPREILDPASNPSDKMRSIEYKKYGVLYPVSKTDYLKEALFNVMQNNDLRSKIIENAMLRVNDFGINKIKQQYEFLQENVKEVDWLFIDRKAGGGFIYNDKVRRILSYRFKLHDIRIEDKNIRFKYFKPVLWFWSIIKARINADILVEESFDTLIFPVFRKNIKKVAIIHHIDNSALPVFFRLFIFPLERLFYRNIKDFSAVIVVSEYWKRHFLKKGCKNVYKIYNSFKLSDFNISSSQVEDFKKRFNLSEKPIVYIGNCQAAKGVVESYEALKDLNAFLVTSGEKKVNIPARNLNLDYQDYLCLLKSASVVITMSKFKEGWCRTAHEAMLLKTPVIGSGVGGMKELLEGGKQIVCPSFKDLKKNVEYLLNDKNRKMAIGEDGFNYAKEFTEEKFKKDWFNFVSKL